MVETRGTKTNISEDIIIILLLNFSHPLTSDQPGAPVRAAVTPAPIQQGTLMPFSGELVPGAFLSWLRAAAPEVVDWLHDGHRRRLFTCSSLHFSSSMQPHLRAEREHIHLPLDPHKTCTVRLTLLLGELFPLFSSALTQFSVSGQGARSLPFIQPGKQLFLLEEVLLTTDDATGWTGFTSIPSCSSLCLAPNPLSVLPCPYHAIRDAPSVSCDTLCPRHPHSRRCCLR